MLSNSQDHKYSITFGNMGKMYFPDEVPNKKTNHTEHDKAYNREWRKVFLKNIGVRIIIAMILMICYILFFE